MILSGEGPSQVGRDRGLAFSGVTGGDRHDRGAPFVGAPHGGHDEGHTAAQLLEGLGRHLKTPIDEYLLGRGDPSSYAGDLSEDDRTDALLHLVSTAQSATNTGGG